MQFSRMINVVDSHTEGMPTRVVTGGVGRIPGDSMSERRRYAIDHLQALRGLLMDEPRGHSAMSGAILQPPTREDADFGVLYIEAGGIHAMCGHGTMGVVTVLVETGMVPVHEPETIIRLDTPAGLVTAYVEVKDGRATSVRLRNVTSFVDALDLTIDVPGLGEIAYDMAYGGNFYPMVETEQLGLDTSPECGDRLLEAGVLIMDAINERQRPRHPEDASIGGVLHVEFLGREREPGVGRSAVANYTRYFDRSPCGTGTSARLAQLHARGKLSVGDSYLNTSIIGSRFTGRIEEETTVAGRAAIIPSVTGRAWITGMGNLLVDPTDPFPAGFKL